MAKAKKRAVLPHVDRSPTPKQDEQESEFLFIQVQQTTVPTRKPLSTVVRKHVMTQRSRRRLNESSDGLRSSPAETAPSDMRKQLTRFRLDRELGGNQKLRPLAAKSKLGLSSKSDTTFDYPLTDWPPFLDRIPIQDSLSSYRRDPFIVYPIHADEGVQSLFAYYVNHLNNKTISQNPDRDFIPIVLGDAACFHVLLATLLQFQYFQGKAGGSCFWYHRGAAIAALNQELSHGNPKLTDTVFYAVGMLLYLETRIPNLRSQTAALHITALMKLLRLRSGVVKVELYCMLLRLALWCSINPPMLKPPLVESTSYQNSELNLKVKRIEQSLTPFPANTFDDLRLLICLKADYGCHELPSEESKRRSFSYHDFVTQCLERISTSISTPPTTNLAQSKVMRCIQLGQMLFLYTAFPSMSVSGIYCQSAAIALKACLEENYGESEDLVQWSPQVLCWILINGAITKCEKSLEKWYLKHVASFINHHEIRTFSQLENLLHKVVYTEGQFGSACRNIWMDISTVYPSE